MGLWGVIYPLFCLGARGVNGIKNNGITLENKQRAIDNGELIYYDCNHRKRLVKTDEPARCGLENGDVVIRGEDGRLIKNETREEKLNSEFTKMAKQYAEDNNLPIYPIGTYYNGAQDKGMRFKDRDMERYYVAYEVEKHYSRRNGFDAYKIVGLPYVSFMTNRYKENQKSLHGFNDFYFDYLINKHNNNPSDYQCHYNALDDFPFYDEKELKAWYNQRGTSDFKRSYEEYKKAIKEAEKKAKEEEQKKQQKTTEQIDPELEFLKKAWKDNGEDVDEKTKEYFETKKMMEEKAKKRKEARMREQEKIREMIKKAYEELGMTEERK